jgi:hypothetical protein
MIVCKRKFNFINNLTNLLDKKSKGKESALKILREQRWRYSEEDCKNFQTIIL